MVWSSCDGSIAVTRGAWQRPDSIGYFITVWQRQKNGDYKWVLDQGDTLARAEAEPDAIEGVVADCPARSRDRNDRPGKAYAPEPLADPLSGQSNDRTLAWTTTVDAANGRAFSLALRKDGTMREVLHASAKPSAG
jgi:hypothetical protein